MFCMCSYLLAKKDIFCTKKLTSAAPLGLECGTHKSLSLDEIRMLIESAVYEKRVFRSPTICLQCYVCIKKVVCNGALSLMGACL
jgi:hypothetical protein